MVRHWLLVLAFLFAFVPASAADISLDYTAANNNVAYNEAAKYTITVTNNQNEADSICLKTPDWGTAVFSDYIVGLAAKSSGKVTLQITPPSDVYIGQYAIEVAARSCTKPEISNSVLLKVTVNSELPHIQPVVDLPHGLRPHEYDMNLILKNAGSDKVDNLRGTVYSDLFGEKEFAVESVDGQGAKVALRARVSISSKAKIGPHLVYVDVYQGDKLIKKHTERVEIVSEENIVPEVSVRKGIISKTYKIVLENKGNLAVDDYYFVSLPGWTRFFLSTQPKASVSKNLAEGSGIIVLWVYSLGPAEKTTVAYTISYLPILILLIVLGVAGYSVFGKFRNEFVVTKSVVKEGAELKVKIAVKNKSDKQITGITISDYVPTPLRLVKNFGTLNPTAIKKESGAVKVTWRFDVVYPNEERLLVYGLKTSLGFVGNATLPAAELKFKSKEGRQRTMRSNTAAVKGKVSVSED